MGLRIIDRQKATRHEVTDAERLAGLKAETSHWVGIKGLNNLDIQTNFIDNFRRAKARIDSPAQVAEMASRVRDSILGRQADYATSHGQVDVATLLVLL